MTAPLDEATVRAQRRAADPARSAWVSANAGTGKTHVLTQRVARLLLSGVEPGRVLCLTFTKAAAAEMLHRLFAMLAEWAVAPADALEDALTRIAGAAPDAAQKARARVLFAHTLDAPGRLRIQTIHSFCQDLLARFPLEAGVTPGFEVQDERTAAELLRAARDDVFRRLSDKKTLCGLRAGLTRDFSEATLSAFLTEITGMRSRLRDALILAGGRESLLDLVRNRLCTDKDATPEGLVAAALGDGALPLSELRAAASVLAAGSKSEQQAAQAMHGLLAAADRLPRFAHYRTAFFTQNGAPRARLLNNGTRAAHPRVAASMEAEQARLMALDEACRAARTAQMTETALAFADAWFNTYEALKHARGTLDYEDLILQTRALLNYAPAAAWVLFKLDQAIDHVLVDEAQDTSPEQWEVITRLTEDFLSGSGAEDGRVRTVFAVGDEKQSIYGFQGAAPELFRVTAERMGAQARAARCEWSSETLDLSFRSLPVILEAVDHVFAQSEASAGLTFDEGPVSHRAWRKEGRGLVEVWPVYKPDKAEERPAWDVPLDRPPANDAKTGLAGRIGDAVAGWLNSGEAVYTGDANAPLRPMRPGDILILVRRRDRLVDEMIRTFRERNIPVAGTDRLSLTDHIAVMDLMAAGTVALLPEDDLTLATLLKSPLCGLDDAALFALAYGREGSLYAALHRRPGGPPETERARALMAWLIAHRYLRPFDFFSRLLTERSGRADLLARLGPDAADPIEEFLNQALAYERGHTPALQGFLHWLGSADVDVKREMDQTADEVRIMTVHGAKGLQANVVILPDTCAVPNARHDPHLLPVPDNDGGPEVFVMAPNKGEDCAVGAQARAAFAAKRDAEYRRLLYVALTRARDRLYVCGYETAARARPPGCWYNLVRDALGPHAREVEGPYGGPALRLGEAPPPQASRHEEKFVSVAIPDWAQRPPAQSEGPPRRLSPSALSPREAVPAAVKGIADAARRGTLIHRLLELLPDLPLAARAAAADRFLSARATDLPRDDRAVLARETLQVLEDNRFAPVFGPGSLAEVPVIGTLPELGPDFVIDGQIDRLLVTETRIQVVDFKTGTAPADGEAAPDEYVTQMAAYRALLRRIFPGREVDCALLWTHVPALMPLSGERMEAALRLAAARLGAP